jgi:cytochrome c
MKGVAGRLGLGSVGLMGCGLWMGTVQAAGQDEVAKPEFYTSQVQPIFQGPTNDPMPMSPKLPKISDEGIAVVERWVKAGVIMPEDTQKP